MADNSQRTPLGQSLNRHAREAAQKAIALTGKALPCTVVARKGAIVTVAFQVQAVPGQPALTLPNVTIPVVGSEYIRAPIQIGCTGMTIAADAYLGGMSGLGGGVATLVRPANLTALVFVPIGSAGFSTQDDDVLVMYGPQGVTLADSTFASTIKLTPTQITLTAGGKVLTINAAGVAIDNIVWEAHVHSGVETGSATSGPPVA